MALFSLAVSGLVIQHLVQDVLESLASRFGAIDNRKVMASSGVCFALLKVVVLLLDN